MRLGAFLPLLCAAALLSPARVGAQSLSPTLVATSGSSTTAGGVRLDQSTGEPVTSTFESGGTRLTQGFQQGEPLRVRLNMRALLQGPFVMPAGTMHDSLRTKGLVPLTEPYSGLGLVQAGGGEATTSAVLSITGPNAIVDWVLLELRDTNNSSVVLHGRCALLQRDGDVVDVDGTAPVAFNASKGAYFIAIRHRNHFGAMTLAPVMLGTVPTTLDLSNGSTPTHGTEAQRVSGAVRMLWAGDVNHDGTIKYTGSNNDRDPVLQAIGGGVPTNTVTGYAGTDVSLDGTIKYTGQGNDRDIILQNIGGVVPTNTRLQQLP